MINLISPITVLIIDLVFWFLAFDFTANFDFPLLSLILFGMALAFLIGFLYDAFDVLKSGISADTAKSNTD